ncbi:MAG TPA: hypothetical protein VH720_07130 [Candidatus Limnocylindrales bacterium]
MRLSDWRRKAPHRDAMTSKVLDVLEPVLVTMGTDPDPECWVAWGDDPGIRYAVLAPTPAGLVLVHVRVNQPGEGPRAAAKLVRWPRVQFGELAVETQAGRRLLSFQVEGQILRGVETEAELISTFALQLLAASDGRTFVAPARARRRATGSTRGAGVGKRPVRRAGSPATGSGRTAGRSGRSSA